MPGQRLGAERLTIAGNLAIPVTLGWAVAGTDASCALRKVNSDRAESFPCPERAGGGRQCLHLPRRWVPAESARSRFIIKLCGRRVRVGEMRTRQDHPLWASFPPEVQRQIVTAWAELLRRRLRASGHVSCAEAGDERRAACEAAAASSAPASDRLCPVVHAAAGHRESGEHATTVSTG
jgi:hypothetical protein